MVRVAETLSRTPESAAAARRLVRDALSAWGLEELAEDGALIISELVSNAVQHARSRSVRVTVARLEPARVRIGVVDKSREVPWLREPGGADETGRGLLLVAGVAQGWGTDPLPWGKRVWAELYGGGQGMRGERNPWVGDLVQDGETGRHGIVTDVLGGAEWVLRPESGPGQWSSRRPEHLTVVTPRACVRDRA
ncbi:anti-sigma regulatory factor [Streptomyces rimosus]|uniref:ATP-binding protein n=1 Tax=Streptomyces rimosus TaxID=1927 RepID=UPI0004C50215|nr:ATP-binding protein [Streptomyces rimosus]